MTDVYHQPSRNHHYSGRSSSDDEYNDLLNDDHNYVSNDDHLSQDNDIISKDSSRGSKRSKYSKSKSSRSSSSKRHLDSSSSHGKSNRSSSRSPKNKGLGSSSHHRSRRHRHTRSTSRSTSRSGSLSRSSRSRDKSLSRSRSNSADLLLSSDDDDDMFVSHNSKPTPRKAPKGSSREFRDRANRRLSTEDLSLPSMQTDTTNSNVTVTSITSSATDNIYQDSAAAPPITPKKSPSTSSSSRSKMKRGESKRRLSKDSDASSRDFLLGEDEEEEKDSSSPKHHNHKSSKSSPSPPNTSSSRSKMKRGESKRRLSKDSDSSSRDLLFGSADEDIKAKAKASRGASSKIGSVMSDPSTHYTDSSITSNPSDVDLLYGNTDQDAKAKERAKGRRRSLGGSSHHSKTTTLTTNSSVNLLGSVMSESNATEYTGSTLTTTPSMNANSRNVEILYGTDQDAKLKAKASKSKRGNGGLSSSSHHKSSRRGGGLGSSSHHSSRRGGLNGSSHHSKSSRQMDLLYGDDHSKRSKNTSSSKHTMSTTPGVEEVYDDEYEASDTRELLYGNGSKKGGGSRGARSTTTNEDDIVVGDTNGEENAPEAAVQGEVVHEKKGKRRSKLCMMVAILCFLFVCIIGGVAAFVSLRNGGDSTEPVVVAKDIGNLANATIAPTESLVESTLAPTNAPTELELFQAPTEEECEEIANNATYIPPNATRSDFDILMDVTVSVHGEVSDDMVQELMQALQQIFMPALAGCDVSNVGNLNRRQRRIRQLANSRYIILNGFVGGIETAETECEVQGTDEEGRSLCYRLVVEVSLYLKAETEFLEIASLISEQAQNSGNNLVVPLDLSYPFSEIKIIGVDSSVPDPSSVPSLAPSVRPTSGPSAVPSAGPTNVASGAPTATASEVPSAEPSSSPTMAPVVSSASPTMSSDAPTGVPSVVPSNLPSVAPSMGPSMVPSLLPSQLPSRLPSIMPSMTPTECTFCTETNACDESVNSADFNIGCGACGGSAEACILISNPNAGGLIFAPATIGENACQQFHACESTKVDNIQDSSCIGEHSCFNRIVSAAVGSCHGYYACASSSWTSVGTGKLRVGTDSCHGRHACNSHTVRAKQSACQGDFACAGRSKMYVEGGACNGENACSGHEFTSGVWQAETEPSYFGKNSCTCQNCCVCMKRVVGGRCTTPGECCDTTDPAIQVSPDNTEAEMKVELGVTDLDSLFP